MRLRVDTDAREKSSSKEMRHRFSTDCSETSETGLPRLNRRRIYTDAGAEGLKFKTDFIRGNSVLSLNYSLWINFEQ